ncbi:hypothetical protein CRUP_024999 [Coryphaenoides rupestris]|nr:hypothetical protein CRUP_024999 [Coryphaenoides rupestris]
MLLTLLRQGTISSRITKTFGLKHLSSGDLLRTNIKYKTDLGLLMKSCIDLGQLIPDDVISRLILSDLRKMENNSWLLDGDGATRVGTISSRITKTFGLKHLSSGDLLRTNIKYKTDLGLLMKSCIDLGQLIPDDGLDDVTGEPLVQRDDDTPETVNRRLQAYRTQTEPVLEYYRSKGFLETFSGTETNKIWPHVEAFLSRKLS